MQIEWSGYLCLGSVLAALLGLLLLLAGGRRKHWRFLWVLVAAVFLVGAGLGAAETVYELAVQRATAAPAAAPTAVPPTPLPPTATPPPSPTPTSSATAWPLATATPTPSPTPTSSATATPTSTASPEPSPTMTPRPSATPIPSPSATRTRRPTPASTATATATPFPSPTRRPTPSSPDLSSLPSGELGAMAPSLIPEERRVLSTLDDPPHYVLDVAVDFDALTVTGTAQIRYTNNETETLEALYLRLYPNADHYGEGETQIGAVWVDAVRVDDERADFIFEDDEHTILAVPLSRPLPPSAQITLTVPFTVTVPRRSDRFGYDEGVMSLGHWYPMLAVYDDEGWNLDSYVALGDAFYTDAALYTVHLTVPVGTVIAATGVEIGRMVHRPPRETIVYVSGASRDFALALSRQYETVDRQVGETTITSYYLAGHEQGGRQALQVAADALAVYDARFGRYPYTELDVAETSFTVLGAPGGMEFPGIVFISSEFYRPDSPFVSELDVIVAHEVAHQWWYGVVGNNQVDEPWLDESFATYASILYAEETQDPSMAEMVWWSQAVLPYQLIRLLDRDGPVQSSLLDYGVDLLTYQSIVYSKGALFLAQLRQLLGDDQFFALLQHHYQSYKYDLLAADDFRRSIDQVTEDSEALALYDAVVVRGEPITGLGELSGLDELGGLLDGELSPEEWEALMRLLEELLRGLEP